MCAQCHGALLSGAIVRDDVYARISAPNLARSGLTDADLVRAIRYDIDPGGRQLWLMPADAYSRLSDADLSALVAYLDALPPAASASLPVNTLRPLGRVGLVFGQLDLLRAERVPPGTGRAADVPVDISSAYGAYLVSVAGCAGCHGASLSGGRVLTSPGGSPRASNLTPASLSAWNQVDFVRAMRTGRRPDGSLLDVSMPWPSYAQMTDLELAAIWQYLGVIPSRP